MSTTYLKDSLITQFDKLPHELQLRVLDFTQNLMQEGVSGKSLIQFEGAIASDDLSLIAKSIKEGCEKVDNNEW